MVFLRKKKSDTKNLLGSKRNDRNGKNAAQSDEGPNRAFSKRFFGKNSKDDDAVGETPPSSPESPLNVMVVTTASSSQKSSQREGPTGDSHSLSGTTISDLSQSVIQQRHGYYSNPVETPEAYPADKELPPPSYAGRQNFANSAEASYSDTLFTNYTTVNTSTTNGPAYTADPSTSGFSSYAVTNLLGMFDDACKGPFSTAPQVQCSADTSQQETSSPSGVHTPVWGMAPSEDEDSILYEKREPVDDDSPSPDRSTYHENFELVLDEDEKKDSTRKRLLAWVRKKKKDDKEATYLAVFGADPEDGGHAHQKQAKSSSLVKRMTRSLNKIPEEGEEDIKQETMTPTTTKVVSASTPRGGTAIEVEGKSTIPQASGKSAAERKAKILSDIRKVTEAPTTSEQKVSRSRTWASRTRSWGLPKWSQDKSKEQDRETSSLGRVRSTPAISEGSPDDRKPAKPMWKSVVDEKSGRTYYYHRFTRQTTWTKPAGFDDQFKVKRSRSSTKDAADRAGKQGTGEDGADWKNNTAVVSTLRTSMARDSREAKKKEIRRLLMDMAPPDPSSVDQLIEQYEGREDELLTQLRDLVQSQPFDEPLKNTGSSASSDFSPSNAEENETEESRDVVVTSLPVIQSSSMKARTRTATTHTTGQTSRTDKTQKISNVLYGKERVDSIAQVSEANTSLTSHEPPLDTAVLQPNQSTANGYPTSTKRPVIRNRELQVEEFTSNRYGLRTEKYSGNAVHKKPRRAAQQQRVNAYYSSKSETEDDSRYLADNDEPYHYDTDSISALSAPESDFLVRKEQFEASRRKTLDDAIQNQDWELAAVVTEDMRAISFDSTEASSANGPLYPKGSQFYEWTQSELDKFISENDWDAVARYIAHMRDTNNAKSSKPTKSRRHEMRRHDTGKQDGSPRKAVGARSRLQEPTHMRRLSSLDPSESSYYSDDYSSASSFSSEDLKYRKRQEFRC
jgi:hypothetical protein